MPFSVSQKTLERLEWPSVLERLAGLTRTPWGRASCQPALGLFEESLTGARQRLEETSEARAILVEGDRPPLDDARDLRTILDRLERGGVLSPPELLALGSSLATVGATAGFLKRRLGRAPGLAATAELLGDHAPLVEGIERCIDPEGLVRDSASRALAAARREAHQLSSEAQRRIGRLLVEPGLASALQDSYFTVRGDRYVLPVRANSRTRVPGIVHDASASGTTLFIEPQALVELNNRLKQAELTIERETRRVLRELCQEAAPRCDTIEADLLLLGQIDLAFARGALSIEMDAVEPLVESDGVFRVLQLRHPLIPDAEVVPNDVVLGESFAVLVISGPNAGGKTVAMKALALCVLFTRCGLHVPAAAGSRIDAVERLLADIGDEQDIRENLSTFSAHMANLSEIVKLADRRTLVVLDEVGVGTDPGEGAALAQAVLESLADAKSRVVTTTHYNLLKEMADVDERFANASVEFDGETLAPTYRLTLGTPGSSSATSVAARMGMPATVLERANSLLDREDRRLDRMLSELSTSRAAVERERREAARLRQESAAARDDYRARLERLQERREKLFASMRADLESAFRQAHAEVAGVIRDLQRRGSTQDAAQARNQLLDLQRRARDEESEQRRRTPEPPGRTVDWRSARPGDPVSLPRGQRGTLASLPDRRGRVRVVVGAAKLTIAADQVSPGLPGNETPVATPVRNRIHVEASSSNAAPGRLDLRGLRVDEALDRVSQALDGAVGAGRATLEIVHGIGTGALRQAVRTLLRESPYVTRWEPAEPSRGGEGVTMAHLSE